MVIAMVDNVIHDVGMEAYLIKGHLSPSEKVSLYTTQGNFNILLRSLGLFSHEDLVGTFVIIKKDISMFAIDSPNNTLNIPCMIDFN